MTEDHWKPRLILALLPFLLLQECSAQGNFFYYYSPTQRTQINHAFGNPSQGQIFGNPFFSQQQQPIQQPTEQPSQVQQNVPFPTAPPPSFQQSTFLGYNHPQFQQQQQQAAPINVYSPAPPARFQFPLVPPTPSQQPPQQQLPQQPDPTFATFTRFGNNAQLLGQPAQPSYFSTQSPLGTVAPGTFNFFHNPFQYLQQRFMQTDVQPTGAPQSPDFAAPTTTALPPPPLPSPSPTAIQMVDTPVTEITPRTRFSSRFRYVQQPQQPLIRQYNPYTRLESPYTSDLPYTEQRFYSSPTTPTGYAFSLGGDNRGNGATSTVHFSMGPTSKVNQYLTEVTAQRRMMTSRQKIHQSIPAIRTPAPAKDIMIEEHMSTPDIRTPAPPKDVMIEEHESMPEIRMSVPAKDIEIPEQTPVPEIRTPAPAKDIDIPDHTPFPEIRTPAPAEDIVVEEHSPEPITPSTSMLEPTTPAPAVPSSPEPMIDPSPALPTADSSLNATFEPLLKEPSFQTETIAAPAAESIAPEVSRKISETNIPKRLVIRKKVARKRLQLSGSGEVSENGDVMMMPNGVMFRRRIGSANRLPVDEDKQANEESQKGSISSIETVMPSTSSRTTEEMFEDQPPQPQQIVESQPMSSGEASSEEPIMPQNEAHMTMNAMPQSQSLQNDDAFLSERSPSPLSAAEESPMMVNESEEAQRISMAHSASTTASPIQPPPVESLAMKEPAQSEQPSKQESAEVYYADDYENEAPAQVPHSETPSQIMTAVMASPPESDAELPVLAGAQKNDYPGVFRPNSSPFENSAETDQGVVITRVTSSHPSVEHEDDDTMPLAMATPSSTTSTTEQTVFMKDDPAEEQPPLETEEVLLPASQPTATTTTEGVPMMSTSTPGPSMSSTAHPQEADEYASGEMQSGEVQDEESKPVPMSPEEMQSGEVQDMESKPVPMPPHEMPMEVSSSETPSPSTQAPENPMMRMDEGVTMSSTAESLPHEPALMEGGNIPETESVMSSSTTEVSTLEMNPSSTESGQNEEASGSSSTTTMAPPFSSTEDVVSNEQIMKDNSGMPANSLEISQSQEDPAGSQELSSDSEEIGKAQRLALEETLRRLRERQQTSSTSDPTEDEQEDENELQNGRKVFMRRPLQLANLPLPTSRPVANVHAVLDEEEGVDRSQVIEKIQRFRQNFRTTTTKRPRRVTRPSPLSERRLAVVAPVVEDLLEHQDQVDSFSDSSSTPGPATEPATTTIPSLSSHRFRVRTTPSSTTTTTVLPEEISSTTPSNTLTIDTDALTMEEESDYTMETVSSSTEQYSTTARPQMLTPMTDEPSSTTESMMMAMNEDASSTTETDIEPITTGSEPELTMTTTTEMPMMTTSSPAAMTRITKPNITVTTDAPTSDEIDDNDLVYEENIENNMNVPVSSSTTEVSIELADADTTPSSTTIAPLSSTDSVYAYVTTPEPISAGSSATTIDPDVSSSTTPAGQLIIHEILPTMPPIKEVSFVIGESVEDDQSSAISSSANESDELLAVDKAVVRVETNVHVSTNSTDSIEGASVEQQSQESQELTQPITRVSGESSGEGVQRKVRVVIKKQRRLRHPGGQGQNQNGESRRRRRKVLHRRPQ